MTSSSPALRRTAARWPRTRSNIDLPDEIMELILSRCPGKSVVRFKSVSKSWQSIISNPRFSRIHHIQQSKLPENQNMFLFWVQESYDSPYCPIYMILEDEKFRKEYVMDDPTKGFSPLSSCDGLILLKNDDRDKEDEYMLWNPLIEKHIIIPAFTPKRHPEAFRNRPHNHPFLWLHHLYFDSIADDYKILLSYENWYTVYSCKNGIWGDIKDIPRDLHVTLSTTCVDGFIYSKHNGEIVCFDARDGKLHKFTQPNDVEGFELEGMSGRLCLYKLSEDHRRLQLWVMEKNGSLEKSWRKLISMEKEEPDLWNLGLKVFTNEDDVVLSAKVEEGDYEDFIYKYNPRENCFQEIELAWEAIYSFDYFPYSENLYMPSSNIY